MFKNNKNDLNFLQKIKAFKRKYCSKLIMKLDKIIMFCAEKEQIKEVENKLEEAENKLEEAENIKEFSQKFQENKEILRSSIEQIREENMLCRELINEIHYAYYTGDYLEIDRIFKKFGFKNYIQK